MRQKEKQSDGHPKKKKERKQEDLKKESSQTPDLPARSKDIERRHSSSPSLDSLLDINTANSSLQKTNISPSSAVSGEYEVKVQTKPEDPSVSPRQQLATSGENSAPSSGALHWARLKTLLKRGKVENLTDTGELVSGTPSAPQLPSVPLDQNNIDISPSEKKLSFVDNIRTVVASPRRLKKEFNTDETNDKEEENNFSPRGEERSRVGSPHSPSNVPAQGVQAATSSPTLSSGGNLKLSSKGSYRGSPSNGLLTSSGQSNQISITSSSKTLTFVTPSKSIDEESIFSNNEESTTPVKLRHARTISGKKVAELAQLWESSNSSLSSSGNSSTTNLYLNSNSSTPNPTSNTSNSSINTNSSSNNNSASPNLPTNITNTTIEEKKKNVTNKGPLRHRRATQSSSDVPDKFSISPSSSKGPTGYQNLNNLNTIGTLNTSSINNSSNNNNNNNNNTNNHSNVISNTTNSSNFISLFSRSPRGIQTTSTDSQPTRRVSRSMSVDYDEYSITPKIELNGGVSTATSTTTTTTTSNTSAIPSSTNSNPMLPPSGLTIETTGLDPNMSIRHDGFMDKMGLESLKKSTDRFISSFKFTNNPMAVREQKSAVANVHVGELKNIFDPEGNQPRAFGSQSVRLFDGEDAEFLDPGTELLSYTDWNLQPFPNKEPKRMFKYDEGYLYECGRSVTTKQNQYFLEDPTRYLPFYTKFLYPIDHMNFICADNFEMTPIIISLESPQRKDQKFFKVIIWRKEDIDRIIVTGSNTKERIRNLRTRCSYLGNLRFHRIEAKENPSFIEDLKAYELDAQTHGYKFGVLLYREAQTEDEIFSNKEGECQDYEEFLEMLGDKTVLQGFKGYRGGLDVKDNTTGKSSITTQYNNYEIMYHVATLLPYYENDSQKLERKRHIGNDIVVVIFKDSDDYFDPKIITSHFNHVFVVVQIEDRTSDPITYRVSVTCKAGCYPSRPILPYPPVFPKGPEFKEFLLAKLINCERTALYSKEFSLRLESTRSMHFREISRKYVNKVEKSVLFETASTIMSMPKKALSSSNIPISQIPRTLNVLSSFKGSRENNVLSSPREHERERTIENNKSSPMVLSRADSSPAESFFSINS